MSIYTFFQLWQQQPSIIIRVGAGEDRVYTNLQGRKIFSINSQPKWYLRNRLKERDADMRAMTTIK